MLKLIRLVCLTAAATTVLTGCQSRGAIPPNGMTAILRSIPREIAPSPIHLRSGDPSEAQRLSGVGAPKETLPPIASRSANDGWNVDQVEAWVEVTPTGSPGFQILVGSFDSKVIKSALKSRGYQSQKVELTEILAAPGATEAVGIAPGRLVYGRLESVEKIAAFRGGAGSMLDIAGLKDVAIATGRSGATAVFEPARGCPKAMWIAAAARYEDSRTDTSLVWYYPEAEAASRAARELEAQLPPRLPPGAVLKLSDPRNRQAVEVLDTQRGTPVGVIESVRPNGPFEGLPECPK